MRSPRLVLVRSLALLICGCSPPLLSSVHSSPPPSSPEVRDAHNRLDVHYHLAAPARVSAQIQGGDGRQWSLYSAAPRPTAGDYVLQFDGTVPGPGANERQVLPDGDYQIVINAEAAGLQQQAVVPLPIRDADTSRPDITELSLLPDRISPNFDARNDVTHLTYRLAKAARVQPILDQLQPDGTRQRVWMGEEVKAEPGEQSLVWDGQANGQPVANGTYELGVRARDAAGNVVERTQPLIVEDAGRPDAVIVSARIGPRQIIRGGQVCVDAVIRNLGQTVLRTEGPDPGYIYDSRDTYSSIDDHHFPEQAGFWRVGLNWAGSPDTSGATYPYRWGFGRDLQPGEEVPVHGCVVVHNAQDKLVYFAGLIQENIAVRNAGAGLVRVDISS